MIRTLAFLLASVSAAPVLFPTQPIKQPAIEKLWGAEHVTAYATAEALTIPEPRRRNARYLSLHNLPPAERVNATRIVNFVLNSLSTERAMALCQVVPNTDGTLLRFFCDEYEMNPINLDRLATLGSGPEAARTPEPYFNRLAATETNGKIVLKVYPQEYTAQLRKAVYSDYPIFRADWFCYFAMLEPRYHELAFGIVDNEADFDKVIFADPKTAERARAETKGIVVFSNVAQHNRTLTRQPTLSGAFGGYRWVTHDTASAVNDRDYMNVLLNEKFDAQEIIASLPNSLQAYLLTDGKGKRIDVADINVALDKESKYKDPQVWAARNCVACHSQGLRDIEDEVRGLSRDSVALLVADPKQARRIRDLYFSTGMPEVIAHDRLIYKAAVGAATAWQGLPPMTPEALSAAFEKFTTTYYYRPLDMATIAREMGVTQLQLETCLKAAKGIDHTFTGLLQTPPRPVRRDQFEVSYAQLQKLLDAMRQPF